MNPSAPYQKPSWYRVCLAHKQPHEVKSVFKLKVPDCTITALWNLTQIWTFPARGLGELPVLSVFIIVGQGLYVIPVGRVTTAPRGTEYNTGRVVRQIG